MPRHIVDPSGQIAMMLESLLPSASPETRADLLGSWELREFASGQRMLAQGASWEMDLVLDGWMAVRRVSRTGRRFTIAVLGPGHLVGASSAARSPALGENVALTSVRAAVWPGSETRRLVGRDGGLALDFIDRIVLGIGTILDRYDTVTFDSARARLSKVLRIYRDIAFGAPRPILSRGELASLVGVSREMTNRIMRQLEAEGTVRRIGNRGLVLTDEAGLGRVEVGEPGPGRHSPVG